MVVWASYTWQPMMEVLLHPIIEHASKLQAFSWHVYAALCGPNVPAVSYVYIIVYIVRMEAIARKAYLSPWVFNVFPNVVAKSICRLQEGVRL